MSTQQNNIEQKAGEKSGLDEAKEAGRDLRDSIKEEARSIGDTARQHAAERADEAKQHLADQVSTVGQAFRRASEDLRAGSPQEQVFGQAANTIADLADGIRGKDLGAIVDDMNTFARRNPLVFLGGAALLGFAGARLARASQKRPRNGEGEPDTGHSSYPSAYSSASHLDRGATPPETVTSATPRRKGSSSYVG